MGERQKRKQDEADKVKESLKLPQEFQDQLKVLCDATSIDTTVGIDGFLGFEDCFKLLKLIITLQIRFSLKMEEGVKVERRAALANDDKQGFAKICSTNIDEIGKAKHGVYLGVLEHFGVESELYSRTQNQAQKTPENSMKMDQTLNQGEIDEYTRYG